MVQVAPSRRPFVVETAAVADAVSFLFRVNEAMAARYAPTAGALEVCLALKGGPKDCSRVQMVPTADVPAVPETRTPTPSGLPSGLLADPLHTPTCGGGADDPFPPTSSPRIPIPRILLLLNLAYNACAMVHLIWVIGPQRY